MVKTPRDVTEAELSVLQVLWQQGPATIRAITEILEPERTDAYYSTVKKLLERLVTMKRSYKAVEGRYVTYIGVGLKGGDEKPQ